MDNTYTYCHKKCVENGFFQVHVVGREENSLKNRDDQTYRTSSFPGVHGKQSWVMSAGLCDQKQEWGGKKMTSRYHT